MKPEQMCSIIGSAPSLFHRFLGSRFLRRCGLRWRGFFNALVGGRFLPGRLGGTGFGPAALFGNGCFDYLAADRIFSGRWLGFSALCTCLLPTCRNDGGLCGLAVVGSLGVCGFVRRLVLGSGRASALLYGHGRASRGKPERLRSRTGIRDASASSGRKRTPECHRPRVVCGS